MSDETPTTVPATQDERPLEIRTEGLPPSPYAATTITAVLPARTYERLGTIVLSPEQEALLDEPTPDDELDIRPDGLVYVSHEYVRRRLNKAFGRMGWSLIPGSPLTKRPNSNEYFQRWLLMVGGVYASEALSSREYFENNSQMSIDDVAESIKSDALRRCCKDLGIALEPWHRRFAEKWKRQFAVEVVVQTQRGNQRQWRRKDGDKLRNELGEAGGNSPPADAGSGPPSSPALTPASPSTPKVAAPRPVPAGKPVPPKPPPPPPPAAAKTSELKLAPAPGQQPTGGLLMRQEGMIFQRLRASSLLIGDDYLPAIEFFLTHWPELEDPGEEGRSAEARLQEIMRQLDGRRINDVLKVIASAAPAQE
jgi:hypothetical protein